MKACHITDTAPYSPHSHMSTIALLTYPRERLCPAQLVFPPQSSSFHPGSPFGCRLLLTWMARVTGTSNCSILWREPHRLKTADNLRRTFLLILNLISRKHVANFWQGTSKTWLNNSIPHNHPQIYHLRLCSFINEFTHKRYTVISINSNIII